MLERFALFGVAFFGVFVDADSRATGCTAGGYLGTWPERAEEDASRALRRLAEDVRGFAAVEVVAWDGLRGVRYAPTRARSRDALTGFRCSILSR